MRWLLLVVAAATLLALRLRHDARQWVEADDDYAAPVPMTWEPTLIRIRLPDQANVTRRN